MKLRRDIRRDILTGDIRISGQCHRDEGKGIHSGWAVKTWSDPRSTSVYLPSDLHWIITKSRKVVRWAPDLYPEGHPPQDAAEDTAIDPQRKAFILTAVDQWEKTRFD